MSEYPLVDTETDLLQQLPFSSLFDEGKRSAAAAATAMATEEMDQRNEAAAAAVGGGGGEEEECVYKTKVIQFLGRTTPIILQNDNGPCPLLAICNVLLLKNNLNLSVDIPEVSVKNLLHLVGERIIDSNSNVENKDVGYTQNQEQNMGDALDLLPRLSTGIDVNLQFKRIDDFEFTPECAIFDLLDIPLYHGWIVDPQDCDTAEAIGSKSYNTLMGELVALETKTTVEEQKSNPEEDSIDFAAATTATLGVPSPSLGRAISFDDSPLSISCPQGGKGDVEEEVDLLRALKLSSVECQTSVDKSNNTCVSSEENTHPKSSDSGVPADTLEGHLCTEQQILHLPDLSVSPMPDLSVSHNCDASSGHSNGMPSLETVSRETNNSFMEITAGNHSDQSSSKEFGEIDFIDNVKSDALVQSQREDVLFSSENSLSDEGRIHGSEGDQQFKLTCHQDTCGFDNQSACDSTMFSNPSAQNVESDSSGGRNHDTYVQEDVNSSLNNSEPMYEGEECILDAEPPVYETQEAVYEGEMALTEQADKSAGGACTQPEGDLIRSFLRNNASQLTIYGLFCLQEGLKERELCVFFRNNHFSTMFKLNGELYLLATDQGYIHQPDLVWEKLNEVNGDTVFMTGNFTEFKLESHGNITWDEQNVMTSTVDYLASMDTSTPAASTLNSDMQLAMALQQQEYDNQQQPPRNLQQPPRNLQQPSSRGSGSRLVVGPPQGTRRPASTSNSSSRQDGKSKDKDRCTVM